jgi:sarcosine oxidase, subunit beta
MSTQPSEIVIVGGGIFGCSLAYELAQSGKSVTLLEASEIAAGASGGPGERGVRANARDIRELPLVAVAQERWLQYQDLFDGGLGYRRVGGLWVVAKGYGAREPDIRGAIEARITVQNALGSPSQFLARDEVLEREPELAPSILGAVYSPNDGVGDHTFATSQFAREAAKCGAVIRTGARVVEILHKSRHATAVKLEDGELVPVGGHLILLANTGLLKILGPFLTDAEPMPVYSFQPQMTYVSNPDDKKINHLLGHMQRPLAIKQLPDGTIMISGGVTVSTDADGVVTGTLPAMSINITDAVQTMPFLERSSYIRSDATRTDMVTVDGIPIVGKPNAFENTIYGFGWSGHGYAISLGFTKYLTAWILHGSKPNELEPFSPLRFVDPTFSARVATS